MGYHGRFTRNLTTQSHGLGDFHGIALPEARGQSQETQKSPIELSVYRGGPPIPKSAWWYRRKGWNWWEKSRPCTQSHEKMERHPTYAIPWTAKHHGLRACGGCVQVAGVCGELYQVRQNSALSTRQSTLGKISSTA